MAEFISLISGSSGNATLFSDNKTNILIDCGMSGKKLCELLNSIDKTPNMIDALFITHEHNDHIKGAGIISRKYKIPIYATEGTHKSMDIGNIDDSLRHYIKPNSEYEIGTIGVKPFSISHDACEPVGYNILCDDIKYSLATDTGVMTKDIFENIKGSKAIILESNHDVEMLRLGPYPFPLKQRIYGEFGHLSNKTASLTAVELAKTGTEHFMLGHLSNENNRPEIAMLETFNALTKAGFNVGNDVTLQVANRFNITKFGDL